MKHLFYILNIIIAILFFASCKDEMEDVASDEEPCYTIFVSAPDAADTRAYYKEDGKDLSVVWEKGDVIKVGSYDFFFKGMDENDKTTGMFCHYGAIPNAESWSGKVSFNSESDVQLQKKNNECRESLEATVNNYNLNPGNSKGVIPLLPANSMSLLHIQVKSPVMLFGGSILKIEGLNNEYNITLGDEVSHVFADEGEQMDVYVIVPSTLTIRVGTALKFYLYSYDKNMGNAADGDEYHYYMQSLSSVSAANEKVVKLSLPSQPTHAAIQMGLPSKTKWATTNVGAKIESDLGKYFAFGEIEPAKGLNYSTANYKLYNKNLATLQSEGVIDSNNNLVSAYDAATQNWGDKWKMPTLADFNELRDNIKFQSTTKEQTVGFTVTSKINGKSIFMPFAGHMEETTLKQLGSYGHYWTTSAISGTYAYKYNLTNNTFNSYDQAFRFKGFSIRPILRNSTK